MLVTSVEHRAAYAPGLLLGWHRSTGSSGLSAVGRAELADDSAESRAPN